MQFYARPSNVTDYPQLQAARENEIAVKFIGADPVKLG